MPSPAAPDKIFTDRVRTDRTPAGNSEGTFSFLDRSAVPTFQAVRDLLEDWLTRVPAPHRPPLIGSFRADQNPKEFGSAFWELYLHELYLRSGYQVTVHPSVPGASKRPDFLVEGHGGRFYVEAVQVGVPKLDVAEARRLAQAQDALNTIGAQRFFVSMSHERIGPRPLATKPLRIKLEAWLATLAAAEARGSLTHDLLPFSWDVDGWCLHFHARPLKNDSTPGTPAIGAWGPADAMSVDKHTGLMRSLDSKANRYGTPEAPLVIAVLDNRCPVPTHGYDIEHALYGLSGWRPAQSAANLAEMHTEGHWLTKAGWRRGHAPQTISAINLHPWNITREHPWLWETLEPGHASPPQPAFFARVDLSRPDPQPQPAGPNPFDLPEDWPGQPDFD